MKKINLKNVTLYGVDTSDKDRLLNVFSICEEYAEFGAKKLFTKIGKEYITNTGVEIINTEDVFSIETYNYFNLKRLADFIDTDYVLVVEYDGFILNPNAWSDNFFKYDYIGAPWWYEDGLNVGNGGFSLRSKKLLNILRDDKNIIETFPEDHHICRTYRKYLEEKGIKFAPEELARRFSIEGGAHYPPYWSKKTGNIWTDEFGFHGLHKTDISKWFEQNPRQKNIIKNNIIKK